MGGVAVVVVVASTTSRWQEYIGNKINFGDDDEQYS